MICKSSRLWNFVESSFRRYLVFQYFFFNHYSLETSLFYLETFVLFHSYSTLIYMSTLADFPFRQCRVRYM